MSKIGLMYAFSWYLFYLAILIRTVVGLFAKGIGYLNSQDGLTCFFVLISIIAVPVGTYVFAKEVAIPQIKKWF